MKLQNVQFFNFNCINNTSANNKPKKENNVYVSTPIGHNIGFMGIRVDKGLARFYEFNEHRMPQTVKKYIQSLDDKAVTTPLLAQAAAFALIGTASTVEDIKEAYLQKLIDKMPVLTRLGGFDIIFNNEGSFEREEKITQIDNNLRYTFNSIPKSIMNFTDFRLKL